MNETPLSNNEIKPESANNRRKTLKIIGIVVAAVIVVAGAVYSVYAWQQGQQAQSNTSDANTQTAPKEEEATPTPTPAPSTNPYEGWLSDTLKYEKVTFKYPSTWNLTNTSTPYSENYPVTPGFDKATLVSPTGLTLTVSTGVYGIGGAPFYGKILSVTPIETLGGSYFLGFGTGGGDPNSDVAYSGMVATTSSGGRWPASKNISVSGGTPINNISLSYADDGKPVSVFQNDASYNDALLIIKSLGY